MKNNAALDRIGETRPAATGDRRRGLEQRLALVEAAWETLQRAARVDGRTATEVVSVLAGERAKLLKSLAPPA